MKIKQLPLICSLALASASGYASTPASDIDFNFGGSIITIIVHDTDTAGAGINIPGNSLFNKSTNSDTKIDASLSQIKFGASQAFDDGSNLSSQVVLDFNANNDGGMSPRLREAYVTWSTEHGQLLAGQTWSTFMDMRNIPQSLAEATLSGAVFKRQPLIRWSQEFGEFKYDIALESSTNDDIQNQFKDKLDTSGAIPDIALAGEWANESAWFRATALFNQLRLTYQDKEQKESGYGVQLSAGWDLTNNDRISFLTYRGEGTDRYLLGLNSTGPTWNTKTQTIDLREAESAMVSYTRKWQPSLKSVLAYGKVSTEALDWQDELRHDTFTSTQYAMANLLWTVKPNLTLGVEYNYSQYERSQAEERDNHRIMLGMDWKY
ncbi:porin [Photobacterium sanctipauli]|uniref:Porin n=1 Tax=Photobacterium sanctipauli TaxID=1342794 RepID=A0A2T3NZT1_9GAMM|nr:DcaP family trimeric outer membrane transporter [Photobacterium sanctipauli]PSW21752.1 porin [Photobacterium sanctipauli]